MGTTTATVERGWPVRADEDQPREDRHRDILEMYARDYVASLHVNATIDAHDERYIDGYGFRHLIPGLLAKRGLALKGDFAAGCYRVVKTENA